MMRLCFQYSILFFCTFLSLTGFLLCLGGCTKETDVEKVDTPEYTVCDIYSIPEQLKNLVEEKKENPFKLTYQTKDYLYIAVGYGGQNKGNYNVVVEDFFRSNNALYLDTTLTSNEARQETENISSEEQMGTAAAYPYIIIKCENYDLPVVFR